MMVRVDARSGAAAASAVDRITDLLWSAGVSGIEERSEPDGAVLLISDPDMSSEPAASAVAAIGSIPGVEVEMATADPEDWRAAWRRHARAEVIADRFVVRPPWVVSPRPELPDVRIDPGDAWGHGAHVSTRLALEVLISAPLAGASVLDVGCGSGVLAVAVASIGSHPVVGCDIDAAAMVATRANAERNGVVVEVVDGSVDSITAGEAPREFDIVVANIEATILRGLVPGIAAHVGAGGRLILSGMLDTQVDSVIDMLVAAGGWEAMRRIDSEGWSAVELRRGRRLRPHRG